jgi:DNA repair/transcription protein MET18/MMS19
LQQLSQEKLTKQQLSVVSSFLCDRTDDEECLAEVLQGLLAIVPMNSFSPSNIEPILASLVQHVNMKSQVQNTRYMVYKLLETILSRFASFAQRSIGDIFIKTYVTLSTGEKDPRNLMTCFAISYEILANFDISAHADDLFDVIFCYFPITFVPPKNDPYGITTQNLKDALLKCISANGLLAKEAFPGLIEKLNSSAHSVKNDALTAINASIQSYAPEYLTDTWRDVWDGIKYEVLHGSEEVETAGLALKALSSLGTALGKADNQALLVEYLDEVKKETKEKLQEPQQKLAVPGARLASGIAQANVIAFETLSGFAFPIVFSALTDAPSIDRQKGALTILLLFLQASQKLDGNGRLLLPFKEEVFETFSKALMGGTDTALRIIAIDGLSLLTQLTGLVADDEVGLIVQYFDSVILKEDVELAENALDALTQVKTEHILNIAFPALLAELPDTEKPMDTVEARKDADYVLSALAALSGTRPTFEVLSIRLVSKLDVILHSCTFKYPLCIILTLLEAARKVPDPDMSGFLDKLAWKLVKKVTDSGTGVPLRDDRVVEATALVISEIVRRSPDVSNFTSQLVALFEPYLTLDAEPTNLVALFVTSFAPVKDVDLGVNVVQMLFNVAAILDRVTGVYQRGAYLRLVALLANKWVKPEEMGELDKLQNELWNAKSVNGIEVLGWLAKGLLLKAHALGYQVANRLVDLLGDAHLGKYAARMVGVFVSPDSALCKENGLIIRQLYKQRVFSTLLPKLIEGFKAGGDTQLNFMVALSGLLQFTPSKIILPDLPKFLPLLLQSLDVHDAKVQEAAINTVLVTLHEASDIFAKHSSTMIPKLLKLAQNKKNPSSTRSAALICLHAFPTSIEMQYILPYRERVINELAVVLDDPKRDVRRDAVVCRQVYFELGRA